MEEYVDFLKDSVVADQKIVTYRLLSRSLKVHVDVAKEMLYAFHMDQNKRRPGSVHATYMLIGYRRAPGVKNSPSPDEDAVMISSPFDSTQRDDKEPEEKCVVVVSQEKLEEMRSQLSRLVSIHVYSLEPTALTDLNAISSTCQDILSQFADEDKLAMWSTYGTIHNSVAKIRARTAVSPVANQALDTNAPKAKPITAAAHFGKKTDVKVGSVINTKSEPKKKQTPPLETKVKTEPATKMSPSETNVKAESATKKSPPETKVKTESAAKKSPPEKTQKNFFSNWNAANQKAKDKKADSQGSPTVQTPREPSPTKMETDSEGEEEEPAPPMRDVVEDSRKRKAKQQELEAMMDLEDEEPPAKKKTPSPKQSPTPEPPPSTQPPSTTNGGRRRRKRKVSKKTTTKDTDGYLVTKLEQVWESFSEDEPEPPLKVKPKNAPTAMVKGKAKKSAVGQGNIMSFFQKK